MAGKMTPEVAPVFPKRASLGDGAAIHSALQEDGCVVAWFNVNDEDSGGGSGGGVAADHTLAALECARRFFELPIAAKRGLIGTSHRVGYAPALAEVGVTGTRIACHRDVCFAATCCCVLSMQIC
jgi:hypothetical protein